MIAGFEQFDHAHNGKRHTVFKHGNGPAVVVLHELYGVSSEVVDLARIIATHGFTVYVPWLFGEVLHPPSNGYGLRCLAQACISREFTIFATGKTSPVADWLRSLAASLQRQHVAPLGVIGMCFTGGFALAMAVDESVAAPVVCQPSLPWAGRHAGAADLGLNPLDVEKLKARARAGLQVRAYRFTCDSASPAVRFQKLAELLGSNFIGVEIDSSDGNRWGLPPTAHSVLTLDRVDVPGHPTARALEDVLAFFRERIGAP